MKKVAIKIIGFILQNFYNVFLSYKNIVIKEKIAKCGDNSSIVYPYNLIGGENIYLDDNVYIGAGSTIFTTRAKLIINDHVIFGPNVTIITGDHMYIPGRYMSDIRDDDKTPEYDRDVFIDSDVWIGSNVTILKGVKIGRGSIVASGAVVSKDVLPYSIVGGIPAKFIKFKWDFDDILIHENILFKDRVDCFTKESITDFYKDILK